MSWTDEKAKAHPLFNESADSHMIRGFEFIMHGLALTLPAGKVIAFEKNEDGTVSITVGDKALQAGIRTMKSVHDSSPGGVNFLFALQQCIGALADLLQQAGRFKREEGMFQLDLPLEGE